MIISLSERQFRAKYPHARFTVERVTGTLKRYTVYAGDYLCAESSNRMSAFSKALHYGCEGYITPDPEEIACQT